MGVILHRYEETGAILPNGQPRLRIVESGTFEPGHPDNPSWVVDALDSREDAPEATPRVTPWESTAAPQPWAVLNSVPFGGDTEEPEVDETADETADETESVEVPPKGGAGSGLPAWIAYAEDNNVEVPEGATRDDVIDACEAAGVPTE